jgi:hypothetical protein
MTEPRQLPRLPNRSTGGARTPRTATWIALFGLAAIVAGLIGLVALIMPEIRVIVLMVGAFGFVFGGHYLLWGYWLQRRLSRNEQEVPVEFWRQAAPPEPAPPETDE